MTTKQKLIRLAKKLNCQLEFSPMWDLTAPPGYCFNAEPVGALHFLVFEPSTPEEVSECIQDAYNRLSLGIRKCNCEDCREEES